MSDLWAYFVTADLYERITTDNEPDFGEMRDMVSFDRHVVLQQRPYFSGKNIDNGIIGKRNKQYITVDWGNMITCYTDCATVGSQDIQVS